ncbi:MAG: TIGR00730 family Rossman fold protein [Clostridiales bacterium]|nr:TIGR00730 family Rossman fold protein [Clostridiales bacterium]
MVICIYGASSPRIDSSYIEAVEILGEKLAKRGHSLVYGCGSSGLMGAAARGFKKAGGYVHGVIPNFFEENGYEAIFYESDKITRTETMADRKEIMENTCDAFIVTPGGVGTFEELFQILTLKQLGRHNKAIALFNVNGYFDDFKKLLLGIAEKEFMADECNDLYTLISDVDKLIDYVENYDGKVPSWQVLKIGKKD